MRRVRTFRRRLFASVCVLSPIICLATVGLWVRSYWISDTWTRYGPADRKISCGSNAGRIFIFVGHYSSHTGLPQDGDLGAPQVIWNYYTLPASRTAWRMFSITKWN